MKYTDAYIKSDAFLDTFEWRKVRMEAILKYGKRCQCRMLRFYAYQIIDTV